MNVKKFLRANEVADERFARFNNLDPDRFDYTLLVQFRDGKIVPLRNPHEGDEGSLSDKGHSIPEGTKLLAAGTAFWEWTAKKQHTVGIDIDTDDNHAEGLSTPPVALLWNLADHGHAWPSPSSFAAGLLHLRSARQTTESPYPRHQQSLRRSHCRRHTLHSYGPVQVGAFCMSASPPSCGQCAMTSRVAPTWSGKRRGTRRVASSGSSKRTRWRIARLDLPPAMTEVSCTDEGLHESLVLRRCREPQSAPRCGAGTGESPSH